MKKLLSLLLIIVFFFVSVPVHAQDVPTTLPDVSEAVLTPLDQYDLSPYRGVLLSPEAIATIIADYQMFGEKLKIELDRVKAEDEANKKFELSNLTATCDADKAVIRAQLNDSEKRNQVLLDEQEKIEKSKKNVFGWTTGGAVIGVLLGTLGFYGISTLTK